ncbi:putative pectinesterase/pectinesterase inhibitor 51 [Nymphaea thermarum]|nr:putative pectinesterase/pectinesterase inhibitor 51 [Nymphaea thermarum]
MASLPTILLFLLLLLSATSSALPRTSLPPLPSQDDRKTAAIHQACKATRFPTTCEQTLAGSELPGGEPSAVDLIKAAMDATAAPLQSATSLSQSIADSARDNLNLSTVASRCVLALGNSTYRIGLSSNPDTIRTNIRDVRAWLSVALSYQSGCHSALKAFNTTAPVGSAVNLLDSLTMLTSNALSLVFAFDRFGNDTDSWIPPQTERDGLVAGPSPVPGSGLPAGSQRGFDGLEPDVVVCKDGGEGCLGTVQEAVNSAPENGSGMFVIKIKEGVYDEIVRVPFSKKNVVFLGAGMGKTVITGSLRSGNGVSTYDSATVGIVGDGFMARDITFQNTAGPGSFPAVAFRSESDLSLIEHCEFIGHQDTLYAHSLRQLYRSCRIQGTVDFIFGHSASVFHDCLILIAPRQLSPEQGVANVIAAHGRIDPAQSTGFVFRNCIINGTDEYMRYYSARPAAYRNYLGRPWREYARTVFLNSYLGGLMSPQGWLPWAGEFGLTTLYYGEFENFGPGANTSQRVPWSSQIPSQNVELYSVESFIQGDEWIKSPDYKRY